MRLRDLGEKCEEGRRDTIVCNGRFLKISSELLFKYICFSDVTAVTCVTGHLNLPNNDNMDLFISAVRHYLDEGNFN